MKANPKERLTVTVDRDVVKAANAAVAAGRADSLSAWVNQALSEHAAKERRLAVLAELIADYEAEHGVIGETELVAQQRADRRGTLRVRGERSPRRKPRTPRVA